MIVKSWYGVLALFTGLTILGCQNYGFEELPSSVIKEKRWTQTISIASQADILFIIDNSGSMVGEQGQLGLSFGAFTSELENYFSDKYHIAIITTGMESPGCPRCEGLIQSSCMNETGENGRFQDRIGYNQGTIDLPDYVFTSDPQCERVVDAATKWCFYDTGGSKGFAMVGVNGCGYERGLAPLKIALDDLAGSYNSDFLRKDATLVVVIITDEDDCGEVGDVTEGMPGIGGNSCYFAAKGADPDGGFSDPDGKPYRLTAVEEYYNFLLGLKDNREGMVKFAAIVGIKDKEDLSTTTIEYFWDDAKNRWDIEPACTTAGCTGEFCSAKPGTRYVKLAQLFGIGKNGFVDTICQTDFSQTMKDLGGFVACPKIFLLSEAILDPDLANILINGTAVPRYSCGYVGEVKLTECSGPDDDSCPGGLACVPTWNYTGPTNPPDPKALGGTISFAAHYDPCEFFGEGDSVHIELVYVTP
ncbi:MAG TPA: hypothetical protein VM425_02365 [Myxococcota bacterium]|nr:hypothetical protein [Myxococcota bacterium]